MLTKNNTISVVIITINISSQLLRTLKNVTQLAYETIIIQSKEKKLLQNKRNVYFYPFHNDFSEIRNYGIEKAKGDWILMIDSDEILSKELMRAIPHLIQNSHTDGYWFRRKTYISKDRYLRYGLFYPDYQLRLFRNTKEYRYKGAVHEQLTIPKSKTKEMPYDILHYPAHPKYTSWNDFQNMIPYIRIYASNLAGEQYSNLTLVWYGFSSFWVLLFNGYIRGKGFLDGYAGLRAHVLFALSISSGYILAAYKKRT